jgi:hypothetical protein
VKDGWIVIVGVVTAAVFGSNWLVYRYFAKPVFLNVQHEPGNVWDNAAWKASSRR